MTPVEPVCEHGPLLDCVAVNLSVLLRHAGAEDSSSPFACQWCFEFPPPTGELPVLEHRPLLSVIAEQSGYRLRHVDIAADRVGEGLAGLLAAEGPVLLLGDAYAMPWVPYHGHAHMEHSFIVDGVSVDGRWAEVADGYCNRTEWGEAVPCRARVAVEDLAGICPSPGAAGLRAGVLERTAPPRPVDAGAWLRRNAEAIAGPSTAAAFERFADPARVAAGDAPARFDQFVLACWLVARSRTVHARWLARVAREHPPLLPPGFPAEFEASVVAPWTRAMEFSYIASRRVRLGRAAPPAAFDIVAGQAAPAERELAGRLMGWVGDAA